MVHARRAEPHRQPHARPRPELVAVDPQPEASGPRRLQDLPSLLGVERVWTGRFAEHVRPSRVRHSGGEHRAGHQVEVCRAVAGILRRDDVGAQKRCLRGELAGQAEGARFTFDAELVTALDLHRRRPLGAQLGDALLQLTAQLLLGRGPGRRDGRRDAAAVVALAGHPGGELGAAVPSEDEMGVRVDETGQHRPSLQVELPVGARRPVGRPDPGDPAVLHDHRRVRQQPQRSAVAVLGVRVVRHQLADAGARARLPGS